MNVRKSFLKFAFIYDIDVFGQASYTAFRHGIWDFVALLFIHNINYWSVLIGLPQGYLQLILNAVSSVENISPLRTSRMLRIFWELYVPRIQAFPSEDFRSSTED